LVRKGKSRMILLDHIARTAAEDGCRTAAVSGSESITYSELWERSGRIASWLESMLGDDKRPLVVYGHKDPDMLVYFLACVRSGRAYCPVDVSVPVKRVSDIIEKSECPIIFSADGSGIIGELHDRAVVGKTEAEAICRDMETCIPADRAVSGDDTFYIIFTSGSTGLPKGVKISADNLENFLAWSSCLGDSEEEKEGGVFLNQAPFSFDLSVMDLYTSLYCGGTLFMTDKKTQQDMAALMEALQDSGLKYWVSTPSFAALCCSEPDFSIEKMPDIKMFFFCGETLTNSVAGRLRDRFPETKIINAYGPTETTVAVTAVEITDWMIKSKNALPVGTPGKNTRIEIRDGDGVSLPDDRHGEITILGGNVSTGYFRDKHQSQKVFFGDGVRGYRTGDEGFIKNGQLNFCGRMDLQIKYHGYRIELGDIENNLIQIPGIKAAAVLPKLRNGSIKNLVGFVTGMGCPDDSFAEGSRIRAGLREKLPDYMVPRKIIFLEDMPITDNGKIDRKALGRMIG